MEIIVLYCIVSWVIYLSFALYEVNSGATKDSFGKYIQGNKWTFVFAPISFPLMLVLLLKWGLQLILVNTLRTLVAVHNHPLAMIAFVVSQWVLVIPQLPPSIEGLTRSIFSHGFTHASQYGITGAVLIIGLPLWAIVKRHPNLKNQSIKDLSFFSIVAGVLAMVYVFVLYLLFAMLIAQATHTLWVLLVSVVSVFVGLWVEHTGERYLKKS